MTITRDNNLGAAFRLDEQSIAHSTTQYNLNTVASRVAGDVQNKSSGTVPDRSDQNDDWSVLTGLQRKSESPSGFLNPTTEFLLSEYLHLDGALRT